MALGTGIIFSTLTSIGLMCWNAMRSYDGFAREQCHSLKDVLDNDKV